MNILEISGVPVLNTYLTLFYFLNLQKLKPNKPVTRYKI